MSRSLISKRFEQSLLYVAHSNRLSVSFADLLYRKRWRSSEKSYDRNTDRQKNSKKNPKKIYKKMSRALISKRFEQSILYVAHSNRLFASFTVFFY